MDRLLQLIREARFVFVCGNGGSASTAEHFTNDLFSRDIKAICLNSNVAILTRIANDKGYPYVFSEQLKVYGSKEDLLITISCSGTSPNIIAALEIARFKGMNTYGFETFTDDRDYGKLEDKHLQFVHELRKAL